MTPNHIKTDSKERFLSLIKSVFGIGNVETFDNEGALSVLLATGTPNSNVMVGRLCKHTQKGIIMDRRSQNESDTTLAERINSAPKRRGRDEKPHRPSYKGREDSPFSLL